MFVAQRRDNPAAQDSAFGIALDRMRNEIELAAVDDIVNAPDVWVVH